ncbi:MBL fold metallo-hydrolase [Vibrio europaeus]|uniref:MBL fold metallo-hydrolase n=1 Tax=Vibrio europaeus TaxID=300876 RepID=UPI00148BCDC1|nr:MBL fold metallo-hydrolase [Vibrio europaeus]NOH21891.1 MBL fold metallo-hydrolase [Vibrio europaeus]
MRMFTTLLSIVALFFASASSAENKEFKDPVIGSKGYYLGSYGDGAYWVTDGLYNSMFVVSDDGVIVIDAPPTFADKIPQAISEVTDKPVKYFIYSHHHKDHTGGSAIFGPDVTRIAHELAAQELRRKNDPNRPLPSVTFSEEYTLNVGGQRIELAYPGLQHSPGNILIFLPKQKILMLVDVLYAGWVPYQDFALAASISGFYSVFKKAEEYDFESFQGGHVGRPGNRKDFDEAKAYVEDVYANAIKALQVTSPPISLSDKVTSPVHEPYVPITMYVDTTSELCAHMTLEKWGQRLKATSLFTKGHCKTTINELLID